MPNKTENDIARFFQGRPGALRLFKRLRKLIERNGSPKIVVSRTQISFGEDYKYVWIWLPQRWIAERANDSVTLTIVTGDKLESDRIVESVQPKKGYWTHHIVIDSSDEIDGEIEELVQESYRFYLNRVERKKQKGRRAS